MYNGAFGLTIVFHRRDAKDAEERFYYLVNFIMATYVNQENLIFINELKNDPTIIIDTECPLSSQFTAEFVGPYLGVIFGGQVFDWLTFNCLG